MTTEQAAQKICDMFINWNRPVKGNWTCPPKIDIENIINSINPWIKASERAPTEKDGNEMGLVLSADEEGATDCDDWMSVAKHPTVYPKWMPIPPLPIDSESEHDQRGRSDNPKHRANSLTDATKIGNQAARQGQRDDPTGDRSERKPSCSDSALPTEKGRHE